MKTAYCFFAFAGALVVAALALPAPIGAQPKPTATVPPTTVHEFKPPHPSGKPEEGNCWTNSLASNRPNAYRCMVVNEIYDPCFASSAQYVVCGSNPAKRQSGFMLHATKPLPPAQKGNGPIMPFLIQLRDGTLCEPETGTRTLIGKTLVSYSCDEKVAATGTYVGLADTLNSKSRIWTARRIVYRSGPNGPEQVSAATVQIAAVWR